jgi:kynureninase
LSSKEHGFEPAVAGGSLPSGLRQKAEFRGLCGTPPIIGLSALEQAVDLFLQQDLSSVFTKGQELCSLFIDLVEARCPGGADARHAPRSC